MFINKKLLGFRKMIIPVYLHFPTRHGARTVKMHPESLELGC